MFRSTIPALAASIALLGAGPAPAKAQAAPPAARAISLARSPGPMISVLKSVYHVRLTSTWPQETGARGCRNGGEEAVEGTLTLNDDGSYAGTFSRRTQLLFCGAHGPHESAAASSCAITLTGEGRVVATGEVMEDGESPSGRSLRLTWMPGPGHAATVTGECAEGFKQAVKAMYLSTPHAAEFALTPSGAGPRSERLE